MVFARPLVDVVAPGFTGPGEAETLVRLMRIILPAQFFLVVGGVLSAALQAQDRHFLPAMAPLVYSAGVIIGGLVGARYRAGADGFAWGVLAGAAARAIRAAACRAAQGARTPLPDPLHAGNADSAALPLAVISDHDGVFNRRSSMSGSSRTRLHICRRARCPIFNIRADTDESADGRIRHGGRRRGLSNYQPDGRGPAPSSRPMASCAWRCG